MDGRDTAKKVRRKPEEIIKVFLPLQPIISEEEFETVQQVLESRRRTIVAARRESEPQFAYNGYLFCGECDSSIYTKHSQQLFYFCSSQHTRQRRRRELQGLSRCSNKYMLRDKIEPRIDCGSAATSDRPVLSIASHFSLFGGAVAAVGIGSQSRCRSRENGIIG